MCVAVCFGILTLVVALTQGTLQLYPFGIDEGDNATPKTDEGSGPEVPLNPSFGFYGTNYSKLYVNNDGSVTFLGPETFAKTSAEPPGKVPAVCVYCADISVNKAGTVWYRITTDLTLMTNIGESLRRYNEFKSTFTPSWALVATWHNVTFFYGKTDEVNTFQAVLATDGETSSVELLYSKVTWVSDAIDYSEQYPDQNFPQPPIRTQAGFFAGDDINYYLLKDSRSEEFINVTLSSNVGIAGKFLYRVDNQISQPSLQTTTTPMSSTFMSTTVSSTVRTPITSSGNTPRDTTLTVPVHTTSADNKPVKPPTQSYTQTKMTPLASKPMKSTTQAGESTGVTLLTLTSSTETDMQKDVLELLKYHFIGMGVAGLVLVIIITANVIVVKKYINKRKTRRQVQPASQKTKKIVSNARHP